MMIDLNRHSSWISTSTMTDLYKLATLRWSDLLHNVQLLKDPACAALNDTRLLTSSLSRVLLLEMTCSTVLQQRNRSETVL